jgi:3-isopropylmalate dehydrogenase
LAAIASVALMFRYTLHKEPVALAIEQAIERILKRGVRTAELPGKNRPTTTTRMGDLVAEVTQKILKSSDSRKK